MAKNGKNGKKVGTHSGNKKINSDPVIETEDKKEKQEEEFQNKANAEIKEESRNEEKDLPCEENVEVDDDEDSDVDEEWDLKKIMSIAAIKDTCPIKCSHEECTLVAGTVWISNQKPSENWYSCLDCQENDFDGWPDFDDLPVKHMTQEHKSVLIEYCSKYKDCTMPNFACSPTKDGSDTIKCISNTITPPPASGLLELQQDKSTGINGTITPNNGEVLVVDKKKVSAELKPSKAQLEIHRKWQAAAEAAGGPTARIVLHKPTAKNMIFDFLFDTFRPMNITEIHKGLKAVVPSPILKACLDDMALDNDYSTQFVDSDSDDEGSRKAKQLIPKKSDPTDVVQFKHSLSFKGAKGSNSGLYYVNYNEAKGGDGLDREEKNQLASDILTTESNYSTLQNSLKAMRSTTEMLQTEPYNNELNALLVKMESESSELTKQLQSARQFKVNEKHKDGLCKRVQYYSSFWRKRRKLCMDFLICMEELTDGTVAAKSCLSGNGQIDIDSDEAIIKLALDFAGKKRNRFMTSKVPKKPGFPASENFVAVMLDSHGNVQRVYLGNDETSK